MNNSSLYEVTIGLEVHVQLKTTRKMFCGCLVVYGDSPNTHTCPTCLGLPGALPMLNREGLLLTVRTGLLLGCHILPVCKFDRKNYYYPDMPKNYQISQYDEPLCLNGGVPLPIRCYPKDAQKMINTQKIIPLTRIHLEEDVAKSFHFENFSGIDFNRAGTPLMEIVSEPKINSPEEAFAYLSSLRQIVSHGNISDADMEKGQMRCDVNVSVRPKTQKEFGTKIEIKNLNSISGVRRALAFEIERQIEIFESGGKLSQETRRWDDDRGETTLMRIKESAHDYRYFPDPDLPRIDTFTIIELAKQNIPELPESRKNRLMGSYDISEYDASILADDKLLADYFEKAAKESSNPKLVANWVLNDLLSALGHDTIDNCLLLPQHLCELVQMIEDEKISGRQAKDIFVDMLETGLSARAIVVKKGIKQESDIKKIEEICQQVIQANPDSVNDFKLGKTNALNFLKGQVMKMSKGQINPVLAGKVLQNILISE